MSKHPRTPPVWLRAEPGTRKPGLTRARIAEVAIELADQEGFDAVSMRRIAEELGVGTMSLYYYVKTRAELMALVDDALMAELVVPKTTKGSQGLLDIALRTAGMLARHPWALIAMRGASPGPNALRHAEQCLEALSETKLAPKAKLTLLMLVDDLVFGHVLRQAESRVEVHPAFAKAMLKTGGFPRLQETYGKGRIEADDRGLERGLKAIISSMLSE